MFTGLIEQCGKVAHVDVCDTGVRLVLDAVFENTRMGESIAVNGVCLTLVLDADGQLAFDVSPETLAVTGLNMLREGDHVHLERALLAEDRFGGHYVTGHVDTTACVASVTSVGDYTEMVIEGFTRAHRPYLCPKGSVTLDGVSLTINAVTEHGITVMLVPHTLSKTTLSDWMVGRQMNVEFDYVARVLVHQLGSLSDSTIMSLFRRPDEGIEVSV
jgi:riboflavin synthase